MRENDFRRIALAFQGAIEAEHMGHPDFRANGRIFATLRGDGKHGMVVLQPEQQARFIAEHPDAFLPETGAWGRQGCTRVRLSLVDQETLGEAMTLAWQHSARARKSKSKPKPKPMPRKPAATTSRPRSRKRR